jgi:hypothetical protein
MSVHKVFDQPALSLLYTAMVLCVTNCLLPLSDNRWNYHNVKVANDKM